MTTPGTETIEALAAAFARGLANNLRPATLAAIDAENATRGDDSCASHDWLDANEIMDDAFVAVMGHAPRPHSSTDAVLINAAWARAKTTGFARLAVAAEVRR